MKMYYFNPNNHWLQFFVMAENKTKAHKYLLNHLKNVIKTDSDYSDIYKGYLETWEKVNPLDDKSFPDDYTLEEHEVGSVIETEIS